MKKILSLLTATVMLLSASSVSVFAETSEVTGDYDTAVSEIKVPKVESNGTVTDQGISDTLKTHLDTADISGTKDTVANTITVSFPIKNVYLSSDYLNGKTEAGISYYNMLNFFTNIKQVKQLLTANTGFNIVDSNGDIVDEAYIDELLELLQQINDFDPDTNLEYDDDSAYDTTAFSSNPDVGGTDVIATSQAGNVSIKFHIDSHGWWLYDLGAHDSITGLVMGYSAENAYDQQHDLTVSYGNFFNIKMKTVNDTSLYMLRNTDLENPMIYVSADGTEAFMIDVDFYGENVLNDKIKSIIGPNCNSLKIFLTHNHGDHVNNLAKIAEDDDLKNIVEIIWPENEPHTVLNGVDLVKLFGDPTYISDMDEFTVAGTDFQFVEIPNEHTPGGGQLADLTNKYLYAGDTLGAQIHLGGSTAMYSTLDAWISGTKKSADYMDENDINYIIGGHTGYLNAPEFATWVNTACEYAKEQFVNDTSYKGGLIIVRDGSVLTKEESDQIMLTGLSDREELKIASMNIRDNRTDLSATKDDGSLKNAIKVSDIADQKYDGNAKEPKPTVTVNDVLLTLGKDCSLTYQNNTEAGTAKIIITGMNSYKGTFEKEFKIVKEPTPTATPTSNSNKVPNTGDDSQTFSYTLILITGICLFGLVLFLRKRLTNN